MNSTAIFDPRRSVSDVRGAFRLRGRAPSAALLSAAALLAAGCQAVDRPVALPTSHSVRSEQLLVLSDFKLPRNHELVRELSTLREQVAAILDLPLNRDPIVVYLFNNETDYRRYMSATFPKLPPRSAYFVGTSTELAVYTYFGHNVREDLRHEYTHGLLHSAAKKVPLWLDEGLAEYFEVAGNRPGGVNREYASRLTESLGKGWHPDLKRLEAIDEFAQFKRADYQESWAWVHFMLNSTPEARRVILSYLKDLRTTNEPAAAISQRLKSEIPEFQERFASYVAQLSTGGRLVGSRDRERFSAGG